MILICCESKLAQAAEVTATRRPNFIILLADDLGYGELGCQGNPEIPTPNIDSLARDGVRMTNGYVTASFCSPSRAGLMTGRFQSRFGYEKNPVGALNESPDIGLPPDEVTIADLLKREGYRTGLVGKWHLGGTAVYHPQRRGFEEFFGFLHEGHYFVPPPYEGVSTWLRVRRLPTGGEGREQYGSIVYSTHMGNAEPAYDTNNPIIRGSQPVNEKDYLTSAFTREAVSFIKRNKEQPFFLYVAYNAVHSPMQAVDADMRDFSGIKDIQRRIFAGMLRQLDNSVGAILNAIEDNSLSQETMVVFLSDNGGPTRELTSSNLPLRGEKGSMYEGGIRIPYIVKWPGHVPSGNVYKNAVSSLDLFPTIATAAGVSMPNTKRDGVDLIPYLENEKQKPHQTLFWRQQNRSALRDGDWKIVRNPNRGKPAKWELYHLGDDLSETRDLAEDHPEKLADLVSKWEKMAAEMPQPMNQK